MNPHAITREFEKALCAYTGAPYAVAVNSCTMALLLSCFWAIKDQSRGGRREELPGDRGAIYPIYENRLGNHLTGLGRRCDVEIPKRTYVGVAAAIIHAGGRPTFRDEEWSGWYQLTPLPVYDSARYFTSDLYRIVANSAGFVCVSFHASKTLGDTQGGAILHDSPEADAWLRRARFDGRAEGVAPKDDTFTFAGWHAYLSPDVSARLLWHLSTLPEHNAPLPNDDYPDLSLHEAFR